MHGNGETASIRRVMKARRDWPLLRDGRSSRKSGWALFHGDTVGTQLAYPHPELNRDQRFRKPPLYPFELWGRRARQKSYPASVTWSTPAPSSYPIGIGSAMMFFLTPRRKGSAVAMSRIIMGLTGLPDPETSGLHD